MILSAPGKLSTEQDLTAGATDSENVIQMSAIDWAAYTDLWWVVDCETIATGDAADTFAFQLVLSQEATLDTNVEVLSRTVTGYQAHSLATAGNHIIDINVGKMLNEILGTGLSDYPYLGMISTVSTGGTVSINAAMSPSEPHTISHAQAVVSNVGVPTLAS
jgi:hypothetical protein